MRMAHDLYYVYLSSLEGSLACRRAELLFYTKHSYSGKMSRKFSQIIRLNVRVATEPEGIILYAVGGNGRVMLGPRQDTGNAATVDKVT